LAMSSAGLWRSTPTAMRNMSHASSTMAHFMVRLRKRSIPQPSIYRIKDKPAERLIELPLPSTKGL
jgi:hypothetical protein